MIKTSIEYKGVKYTSALIYADKIDRDCEDPDEVYQIADVALWEDALEQDFEDGDEEAVALDEKIFFYCDRGFLDNATERDVVKYFEDEDYI